MLIIRGVNVFPSQIEAALLEISETTPHYMMIVDRVNNHDTLEILVEVEERFFSDEIKQLDKTHSKYEKAYKKFEKLQIKNNCRLNGIEVAMA